ncbi:MAG: DNA primase [Candidatus Aenigmatarchaeota archaeon]
MALGSEDRSWSLVDMARYPFLSDAKKDIKEEAPSLEELLEEDGWGPVRRRGKERVIEALNDKQVKIKSMRGEIERENELFSYPISRMLVSSISDNFLSRRYSLGEAERVVSELERENDDDKLLSIAGELDIKAEKEEEDDEEKFTVFFADFLEATERLRSPEWKLVNQDLRKGEVYLGRKRLIRLMKERIFSLVQEGLPVPVSDIIIKNLDKHIEEIKEVLEETRTEIKDIDLGKVEDELFPPCIKRLLASQKEGQNLSHEARFAMTAFLKKVGLSEEEIISYFQDAPDFDREMASYQIEHIIGEISGTEYSPPGCALMKTNGICFDPDSLCEQEWMNHPLTYYSFKKKKGEESEEDEEEG